MTRIARYRHPDNEAPTVTTADDDPRCPECGGAIEQTATYCIHCSADLTDELDDDDSDEDGRWDESGGPAVTTETSGGRMLDSLGIGGVGSGDEPSPTVDSNATSSGDAPAGSDQLLDPDGLVDNTLTVVVGIITGLFVGFVGIFVFLAATGSIWGLAFGLVVMAIPAAIAAGVGFVVAQFVPESGGSRG